MYKLFIFDLDGTLADTVESIAYSANRSIEEAGFVPHEVCRYREFAGDGVKALIRRTLVAAGDADLRYYDQVYSRYNKIFADNCMYKVSAFEGIQECLDSLKSQGIKIAVLSNKPHDRTVDVVEKLFGKGYFDIVQGETDSIQRKPSPQGALMIAEKSQAAPGECVYVGDTNTDMITGKSSKMLTVGVTWGFRDREELEKNHADLIISNPSELLELL
ncbi:phosphoglycolate phosphatase [Anaerobium acetethylicum]|uniref:Phosphoglycolate phosphatase n=2 Tax=Anaerobium acetethylicum TaxID=1619234 RepID=A0A1D3TW24_9FIRM|nr:phosphoglycolate phosphatase [Anaerobium acetethylicum]